MEINYIYVFVPIKRFQFSKKMYIIRSFFFFVPLKNMKITSCDEIFFLRI